MRVYRTGFPHSDTSGSRVVCTSPELIAACRVLHRLLTPRHPPYALSNLILKAKIPVSLTLQVVNERIWRLLEPVTSSGGDNRDRTGDLRLAKPALSQLSYIPEEDPSKRLGGPR